VSRRTKAGWSDPVFFRAGGPIAGPQLGVSATDFILLFMNDDEVSSFVTGRTWAAAQNSIKEN
jgi:lipid-binding SYLF domain-containing protein